MNGKEECRGRLKRMNRLWKLEVVERLDLKWAAEGSSKKVCSLA